MLAFAAVGLNNGRLHVLRLRIDNVALVVPVVVTDPSHGMSQSILVTPLGSKIEPVVRSHEDVQPAPVSGISVKDVSGSILVKHACARPFLAWKFLQSIVVI